MASHMMIHEEKAAGQKIDDGTCVFVEGQYTNAVPQNYQLLNSTALAPVVTSQKKEELSKEGSSSVRRKRCMFDEVELEETPGSIGRYTCPYGKCLFSNYVFGFESKAERNQHMVECAYRDDELRIHVSRDGQMPSARLIDDLVDGFSGDANIKNMFLKSAEIGLSAFSSLKTTITPSSTSLIPLATTQIKEPGKLLDQYPSALQKNCSVEGSGQFVAEYYYPIQSSTLENKNAISYGESSAGQLPAEEYPNNMLENIMNINHSGKLGGHGNYPIDKGPIQINNNGSTVNSYGGLAGAKYYDTDHNGSLENNNGSSYGQLPDKDYSNWTVNSYEELGQLLFEDYSSESGGGAFENNNGIVSTDDDHRGQGEFAKNYGTGNNGIRNSQGNDYEVANSNPQFQDEASTEEGFQNGEIDGFLDEKNYLMDDDICLE